MMGEVLLSHRLKAVASYVPLGSILADIGSDHALLPIYLCQQEQIRSAIAGEYHPGPLQAAIERINHYCLQNRIEVRQGDGLEVLREDEADVIVIAGMGGPLIMNILERGASRLGHNCRYVLQPNTGAHYLRSWMLTHNWQLKQEGIVYEDGHVYEILMFEWGNASAPYSGMSEWERRKSIYMGPHLLEQQNETFKYKWEQELSNCMRILHSLGRSEHHEEIQQKQKQFQDQVDMIKHALQEE